MANYPTNTNGPFWDYKQGIVTAVDTVDQYQKLQKQHMERMMKEREIYQTVQRQYAAEIERLMKNQAEALLAKDQDLADAYVALGSFITAFATGDLEKMKEAVVAVEKVHSKLALIIKQKIDAMYEPVKQGAEMWYGATQSVPFTVTTTNLAGQTTAPYSGQLVNKYKASTDY